MKTARTLVALMVAAFAVCAFAAESPVREPAKVIFDTDMLTDYDDIGAIAVLHALADAGECEILATVSSTRGNSSVAVCEAVNAWYGRPDIPVGCVRGIGVGGSPETGDGNGHGKFREIAAKYARFVKHPDSSQAPDALEVYRQVLSAQPDGSVTVCTGSSFGGKISAVSRTLSAWRTVMKFSAARTVWSISSRSFRLS